MHQIIPSINPFFWNRDSSELSATSRLRISLSLRTSERKKWGRGTSKQYTDSSQEFHGIFSWNRDQRFGAEIVSPSHQGFQRSSFTGRFQGDYRVVSANRPVGADYFAAFFS